MKKILLLLVFAALLFSCQKEKNEPVAGDQEVTFSATLVQPDLKNSEDFLPCKTDVATHAHMVISGTAYDVQVYTIGTKLYTQAIKLAPGPYSITEFFLYKENNGTAGYQLPDGAPDDIVVYATPEENSAYEVYLTHTLPYAFTVTAFTKIELDIEVLCFVDLLYQNFGFFWFEITEIIIREACFFGDLCITDFNLWNYPPYNIGGVMPDEEAQIKIEVYVNGGATPLTVWDNIATYSLNEPLCVEYPDVQGATDNFTFKLYVWVPSTIPGIFTWQLYGTFTTTDDLPIPVAGTDKVVDFAIGTCSPDSDPEYTWLPFVAPPTDFFTFYIRNNDGSITSPWDTDMSITENTEGDGFSCVTPRSGQKVGYGTHLFDGMKLNDFNTVFYEKLAGVPGILAYLNFWVTDGLGHYAIISSENMYLGTDFQTRQEWKVFEFDAGAGLNWFFDSGIGTRVNQYLLRDGVNVTLADFSDNIVLADPGSPYPGYVGTGAPRGGYGFNIIFGDTQANFIQGPFHFDDLSVTVNGITYLATNP